MAMTFLRDGAKSGVLKIFLMGLLVMAAGGLVLTDVGGFFRGGVGRTDVAKVGATKIPVQNFDRMVRRNLRQLGMSPQEAYKLGHINEMLAADIRGEIMIQSAADMGIVVGKDRLAQEVADLIRPLVQDGQTPQDVLNNILMNQGVTEQDFVRSLQRETSANVLREALRAGFAVDSKYLTKDLYLYQNEERDIDFVMFPHSSFKDVKEPSDDQLQTLYDSTKESYAIPETRTLVLGILDGKNIEGAVTISEDELKSDYEAALDSYFVSEQRALEQAILKEESQARDVIARIKNGATMKTAVEAVTGDTKAYLKTQDFEKDGLLDEIKDIAFDGEPRLLDDPIQTALGWHVIKVHGIKPSYTKPFAEVKDKIREELLHIKQADQLYDLSAEIDDLLAGGAAFEDVVSELGLSTDRIENIDTFGLNSTQEDALAAYKNDRDILLETGFDLFEGESSPVIELTDGRFAALLVEKVTEKSYKPFEEVKDQIKSKWIADNRAIENRIMVASLVAFLSGEENADLKDVTKDRTDIEIKNINGLVRNKAPAPPLTGLALNLIFNSPVGGFVQLDLPEGSAIAQIKSATIPNTAEENTMEKIQENLTANLESETITSYIRAKQTDYKVRINQHLLDQVYAENRTTF